MPPLSVLIKPASGNCNMRCDYCFYCDEIEKREIKSYGFMNEETMKNVIRKVILHSEGSCTIAFQGGEPTLCGLDFFRKVVYQANVYNRKKKIDIHFALQTNGFGITEEWCEFFRDNHFLIGLSVDGVREIHDKYRHCTKDMGPTYGRVMETAKMFDQYGVEYNTLTVVHRDTAERIAQIYADFKEKGLKWQQYITCLDPLGEPRGQKAYSLTPEAYGKFLITLFDLWYEDLQKNEQPFIRQFENYVGILAGYMPESCEQRGTCGAMYVVEADGSVYPCDFYVLDDYKLGNFNVNTISELDEKRREIRYIERSYNHPEKCKNCKYFQLCRGGCFRSRLGVGETQEGLNYFCEGYYAFFEACYDRIREIADTIRAMKR